MVLKVVSFNTVGTGVRVDLTAFDDDLFVGEGVTIARTDGALAGDAAIRAQMGWNALDIRGTVLSSQAGIPLGDDGAADHSFSLQLASTALVKSFHGNAVQMNAYDGTIVNDGRVEGHRGIFAEGKNLPPIISTSLTAAPSPARHSGFSTATTRPM